MDLETYTRKQLLNQYRQGFQEQLKERESEKNMQKFNTDKAREEYKQLWNCTSSLHDNTTLLFERDFIFLI